MATTEYPVNHPLAVKKWARSLMKETLKMTQAFKFMGKNANAIVQLKSELKGEGDKVTFGLRMQMGGKGRRGDNTLEGYEEALVTHNDYVMIDQLRHATRSKGRMSEQRVPFSVRAEGRDGLADWWSDRIDTWFFNQLCGFDPGDTEYAGLNTVNSPTSDHQLFVNQDSEASLGASDTFDLTYIDYCVEKAKTLSPLIRPVNVGGGGRKFVMFLHPYQVTDLRTNTDTGQWLDIQKAAMQGGKVTGNPIYTAALGEYHGVVLHESTRIPSPISNVRRALFCGAQAGAMAFGRGYGQTTMEWVEELFDYKNQLGIAAGLIGGLKKTQFNSEDYGTIVVSSYAAAHT